MTLHDTHETYTKMTALTYSLGTARSCIANLGDLEAIEAKPIRNQTLYRLIHKEPTILIKNFTSGSTL